MSQRQLTLLMSLLPISPVLGWGSEVSCPRTLPITRQQILDSSELKEFADDNFILEENGRKLSKQVENTVGKGEIACYEQFLLFPLCFQEACFPGGSKGVIVWEWVKVSGGIGLKLAQVCDKICP